MDLIDLVFALDFKRCVVRIVCKIKQRLYQELGISLISKILFVNRFFNQDFI